jgi:hypothetical protein
MQTNSQKRPLEKHERRGDNNIKVCVRENGFEDENWTDLAQDRNPCRALVMNVIQLWSPYQGFY